MPVETKRKRTSMSLRESSSNKRRESIKARSAAAASSSSPSTRSTRAASSPTPKTEVVAKKEEKKEEEVKKEPEIPTTFTDNDPLPSMDKMQEDKTLPDKEWKTVAESGVLQAAFDRSRDKLLSGDLFEKYWTKPTRKKVIDPTNPPKELMNKIGECTLTIHPHIFEVKLYSVRDKEKEKQREFQQQEQQKQVEQQKQMAQQKQLAQQQGRALQPSSGPTSNQTPQTPNGQPQQQQRPVPTNPTPGQTGGQRILPQQGPPLRQPTSNGMSPVAQKSVTPATASAATKLTPVQKAPQTPVSAVTNKPATPQNGQIVQGSSANVPPSNQQKQAQPGQGASQTPQQPQQQQRPPPSAQAPRTQACQAPQQQQSPQQGPPSAQSRPQQQQTQQRPPQQPGSNSQRPQLSTTNTAQDPVIQLLASKASSDPELKALMRVVASGQATNEQLRTFQGHIDVLTPLARAAQAARQRAAAQGSPTPGPGGPRPPPPPPGPAQTPAKPVQNTSVTPQKTPANNAGPNSVPQKPPPKAVATNQPVTQQGTPTVQPAQPAQPPQPAQTSQPSAQPSRPAPPPQASTPRPGNAAPLATPGRPGQSPVPQTPQTGNSSHPPPTQAKSQGRQNSQSSAVVQQNGRVNTPQPRPHNAAPRQKAMSAADKKHLDICAVVFEFTISSSGDRFMLPKQSILEYRSNGCELLLSYIYLKDGLYQPITLRFTAAAARYLEPISRCVVDKETVLKEMTEMMKNHTRATCSFLLMRLKRDENEIKAAEEAEAAAKKVLEDDQSHSKMDTDGGVLGAIPDPTANSNNNSKAASGQVSKPKQKFKKATFDSTSTSPTRISSSMTPLPPKPKIKIPRSRKGRIADPSKSCHICSTSNTSLWRKAEIDGQSVTVCNACGIKWKTNELKKLNPPPEAPSKKLAAANSKRIKLVTEDLASISGPKVEMPEQQELLIAQSPPVSQVENLEPTTSVEEATETNQESEMQQAGAPAISHE